MIVAVAAVRMVKVAVDEVVDMVAVRNRLVPTAGAVDVITSVTAAAVIGRAGGWIGTADLDAALVDVTVVKAVEMAVVQVVDVVPVTNAAVAAVRAVLMRVIVVNAMRGHMSFLPLEAAARFRRVFDGGPDDGDHVVVGEGVGNMPAGSCPGDQVLVA